MLRTYKENVETEFAFVYFKATTKTVIGFEDGLDRSFQEIFNRIDNLTSEGSGWLIESNSYSNSYWY